MQTEHKEGERQFEGGDIVVCPNCRAELLVGLRFCRRCGFRLGEGLEEYNETRRFDPARPPFAPPAPSAQKDAPPYSQPSAWTAAPMAPMAPMAPLATVQPADARAWRWTKLFMPWRWGWVGWVVLSLVIMVAVGAAVSDNRRDGDVSDAPRISLEREVDGFRTADGGGAFIEGLAGPNSSLERAGLLGGDTITSFDGKPVRDARALRRILRATPIGKLVEVVYMRDGKTITTTMTTEPAENFRGDDPLEARPGGRGRIGVNAGDRVRVPTLGVHGTELDSISRNGPADLAGLKKGDIVIEFGGKPTATRGDLTLRIYEAVPGSTVIAKVLRGAEVLEIPVKMGRERDD